MNILSFSIGQFKETNSIYAIGARNNAPFDTRLALHLVLVKEFQNRMGKIH